MFGIYDENKDLKNAIQQTGCNMGMVKEWQKSNEKMRKQMPAVQSRFENAKAALVQADEDIRRMEQLLQDRKGSSKEDEKELANLLKDLQRLKGNWSHEFLVSTGDSEYITIYETILKVGNEFVSTGVKALILQSEVENLIALSDEILERKEPDMEMLSYFYLHYSSDGLVKLSPKEGIVTISNIYQEEYVDTMLQLLQTAITRADDRKKELEQIRGRSAAKEMEILRPLWETKETGGDVECRAKKLFEQLKKG